MATESSNAKSKKKIFSPLENDSRILQLHLAEYQMITTRSTYWITIHLSLWPILLLVLALVAQVRDLFPPRFLVWMVVAIVQVVIFSYFAILVEQYRNILYIEQSLRVQVSALVGTRQFWLYESFLKTLRGQQPLIWEYSPLAVSLGAILLSILVRLSSRSIADYIGFAINCIGFALSFRQAQASSRTRAKWFQSERDKDSA